MKTLLIIGLILNMVGTAMLSIFAFPQPDFEAVGALGVEDANIIDGKPAGEWRRIRARQKTMHKIVSLAALGIVFLGFALQLLSVAVG